MVSGDIYFGVKDIAALGLHDIGKQRSLPACNRNKEKGEYKSDVDSRMWLLKFTSAEGLPIGMINWYAIHPTSVGQCFYRVASDSEGHASNRFEEKNEGVIAAFANCHAGDVSGNIGIAKSKLKTSDSGYERRMERFGKSQFIAAQKIFDGDTRKVSGRIRFRFQRVDMVSASNTHRFVSGFVGSSSHPSKSFCVYAWTISQTIN